MLDNAKIFDRHFLKVTRVLGFPDIGQFVVTGQHTFVQEVKFSNHLLLKLLQDDLADIANYIMILVI